MLNRDLLPALQANGSPEAITWCSPNSLQKDKKIALEVAKRKHSLRQDVWFPYKTILGRGSRKTEKMREEPRGRRGLEKRRYVLKLNFMN